MDFSSRISRRAFIRTVVITAGASTAGLGLSGCNEDDSVGPTVVTTEVEVSFDHGVASGDPLSDAVIVWTRVTPLDIAALGDETFAVDVEVASDELFTEMVATGEATTSEAVDFTVKFDVTGLRPATQYFYRFSVGNATSVIGRTKTLPVGTVSEARLAVVSCANYPAGFFNVYGAISERTDLDGVVHLGDYIYEYDAEGYASESAEALGRLSLPNNELLTLEDYRTRYAQYHTDTQLQAAHASLPFIIVWDDHEIANDAWSLGAENHQDEEGDYSERRLAAIQAWYEWLPVREPEQGSRGTIFRRYEYGDLLTLHMLDTRHLGRDQALDYADYIDAGGSFDAATFDQDLTATERQLLGAEQTAWLQQGLSASSATWQVLGQQVLMGRMNIPAPLLLPDPTNPTISFSDYSALLVKAATMPETLTVEEQTILAQPDISYNLDAWDGYFVQRETILATALAADKNLVVLSGDTHNAWANNLQDLGSSQVGVEFATASVSSPGLEAVLTSEDPATLAGGLTQLIGPLQYCNTEDRGFLVVIFTQTEARGEWHFVDTITSLDYQLDLSKSKALKVLPGAGNRELVPV